MTFVVDWQIEPPLNEVELVNEANVMAIVERLSEQHGGLMRTANHDGAAHCKCLTAAMLREIESQWREVIYKKARIAKAKATRQRNRERLLLSMSLS